MTKLSISICLICITLSALVACTSYEAPESGLDCGRQFINATYQGNFKHAKLLLLPTEENFTLLKENFEKKFRSRNGFEKETLSKASINIKHLESLGDSVQLIHFINAYNGKLQILKCVNTQGKWQTDLSFSFSQ